MVVARHQTRSTGDMLAVLSQASGQCTKSKRRRRETIESQLVAIDLAGRYNHFSNSNDDYEDDTYGHGYESNNGQLPCRNDEIMRRVPLLDATCRRQQTNDIEDHNQHEGASRKSRWKSCRWLDERQDCDEMENFRRAVSKKSLLESLFSHSNSNQSQRTKLASNNNEDKFHHDHFGEGEVFISNEKHENDNDDDDKVDVQNEKVKRYQAHSKSDKHPTKLLSLLSQDSVELTCLRLQAEQEDEKEEEEEEAKAQRRNRCRRRCQDDCVVDVGELVPNYEQTMVARDDDLMTSCKFPAAIENCCRSIEQQHHELEHYERPHPARKQPRQQHQQQVSAVASARKLASSSPILSLATVNSDYDATGDCSGQWNKEHCDATTTTTTREVTTTCIKKLTSAQVELERKKQQRKLASATATRNGQVPLTKLPRANRTRTSRQLEAALKHRRQQEHKLACQRDLSVSCSTSASSLSLSRPANNNDDLQMLAGKCAVPRRPSQPIGQEKLTDYNRRGLLELSSSGDDFGVGATANQLSLSERLPNNEQQQQILRNEAEFDSSPFVAAGATVGLGGHENCAAKVANCETQAGAKNNACKLSSGSRQSGSKLVSTGMASVDALSKPANCNDDDDGDSAGHRKADNHHEQVLQVATSQLLAREQQVPVHRTVTNGKAPLACQLAATLTEDNDRDARSSSWLVLPSAQDDTNGHCAVGDPNNVADGHQDGGDQSMVDRGDWRNGQSVDGEEENDKYTRRVPSEQMSNRNQHKQKQTELLCPREQMNETYDDLNNKSVTTRLVDTCASSWRQAATLMASPVLGNLGGGSHSGSYKVAHQQQQQQQQQLPSSKHSSQTNQQQKRDNNNPTGRNQYCTLGGQEIQGEVECNETDLEREQRQHEQQQQGTCKQQERVNSTRSARSTMATASQRRLSRPGRSPISLQRQTNARLARHRLKIQQQRQEQLTNLALRERQQQHDNRQGQHPRTSTLIGSSVFGTANNDRSLRGQPFRNDTNDELEIEILPIEQDIARHRTRATNQSSSFLRDLFERLSGRGGSISNNEQLSRNQAQQYQANSLANSAGVALVNFGQHPIATPRVRPSQRHPNNSVAIEICDSEHCNRLDCHHRLPSSSYSPSAMTANYQNQNRRTNPGSHRCGRVASTNMQQLSSSGGGNLTSSQLNSNLSSNNNTRTQRGQTQSQMGAKRHSAGSESTKFELGSLSSSSSSASSTSSSTNSSTLSLNKPFCKICHLSSTRNGSDKLISPCKCSGTMQYIHCGCLLKWLEISNRTNEKPISCELCSHEYTWHKRFNYRRMKLPKCSSKDILLHLIFILALGGMLFCALAPLFYRVGKLPSTTSSIVMPEMSLMSSVEQAQVMSRSREISFGAEHQSNYATTNRFHDKPASLSNNMKPSPFRPHPNILSTSALSSPPSSMSAYNSQSNGSGRLANDEKFILICAAFFFISFFIAIYAQTKTRDTLYGLIVKFTNMNLTYYIMEYDHGTTVPTTNVANTTANSNNTNNNVANDGNNELLRDCSTNANFSQSVEPHNIGTSQNSNGTTVEQQYKGRANNDHLHGHLFENNKGRKASV